MCISQCQLAVKLFKGRKSADSHRYITSIACGMDKRFPQSQNVSYCPVCGQIWGQVEWGPHLFSSCEDCEKCAKNALYGYSYLLQNWELQTHSLLLSHFLCFFFHLHLGKIFAKTSIVGNVLNAAILLLLHSAKK